MANVQEMVLSVPDVSCEHCVKTVNGGLGGLPGVEAVSTESALSLTACHLKSHTGAPLAIVPVRVSSDPHSHVLALPHYLFVLPVQTGLSSKASR